MDDIIAEEITRMMIEEAGDKSAKQMSSMMIFMYTAYELPWGDQPRAEAAVVHDEAIHLYDVDGKYTAYEPSWVGKPEAEKAIITTPLK